MIFEFFFSNLYFLGLPSLLKELKAQYEKLIAAVLECDLGETIFLYNGVSIQRTVRCLIKSGLWSTQLI